MRPIAPTLTIPLDPVTEAALDEISAVQEVVQCLIQALLRLIA